jgi:hypothetical protein
MDDGCADFLGEGRGRSFVHARVLVRLVFSALRMGLNEYSSFCILDAISCEYGVV